MASQPPPSIPPRPQRAKSPAVPSALDPPAAPSIPPRPSRPSRSKSPATRSEEPTAKTIPPDLKLYQPSASGPKHSPPKASSETTSRPTSTGGSLNMLGSANRSTVSFGDDKEYDYTDSERIPQIGRRVPMLMNAGDVQAPTPSATPSGGRKKHVYREEWELDEGEYGQKRRETPYSMSSTDLNAVVAHAVSPGVGVNTESPGVPDEEMGYLASEQYAQAISRSATPLDERAPTPRNDEGNVIHLDVPTNGSGFLRRGNSSEPEESLSLSGDGTPKDEDEEHYSIIAEDEALKRKSGEFREPAIPSPVHGSRMSGNRSHSGLRRSESYDEGEEDVEARRPMTSKTPLEELEEEAQEHEDGEKHYFPENEKPKNPALDHLKRPTLNEHRFPSNDVWEEAPDYSQLETTVDSEHKDTEMTEEDRRAERTVPSRTKSNGEKEQEYVQGQPHHHYEPGDEQEFERENKEAKPHKDDYHLDLQDLPEDERLARLTRPEGENSSTSSRSQSRRKFPSNDIWEDVPESHELTATVDPEYDQVRKPHGEPQREEQLPASPTTEKPVEKKPSVPDRPSIPSRPARKPAAAAPPVCEPSPEKKAAPSIPNRPKPQIPSRPARPASARTSSEEGKPAPPETKPKPPVPSRVGGKLASLKAGFLGDLESRLKLGPSAPKKEEKVEEKKEPEVLNDVRKSRARGPRGRKLPTKQEKPEVAEVKEEKVDKEARFDVEGAWTVWKVDNELDAVIVGSEEIEPPKPAAKEVVENEPKPAAKTEAETEPAEKPEQIAGAVNIETSAVPGITEEPAVHTTEQEKAAEAQPTASPISPSDVAVSTLPGVSGTAEQTTVATSAPSEPEPKPAEKEEKLETAIPKSEHPEDVQVPAQNENPGDEEVKTPVPSRVGTELGVEEKKKEDVDLGRVDETLVDAGASGEAARGEEGLEEAK